MMQWGYVSYVTHTPCSNSGGFHHTRTKWKGNLYFDADYLSAINSAKSFHYSIFWIVIVSTSSLSSINVLKSLISRLVLFFT